MKPISFGKCADMCVTLCHSIIHHLFVTNGLSLVYFSQTKLYIYDRKHWRNTNLGLQIETSWNITVYKEITKYLAFKLKI